MRTTKKNEAREHAIAHLRELLPPGTTVYTSLRHVSRSGMSRRIDLYVIRDNSPVWLSGWYKTATDTKRGKYDEVTVSGCGMDMGYHLVYNLSRTLYPDGYECIGDGATPCPSNDHSNGDRDYTPHHHADGGYALRQRWM